MNRSIILLSIVLATFGYIKWLNHALTETKTELVETRSELKQLKQLSKVNQGAMDSLVIGTNTTLDQFRDSLASCNGVLQQEQHRNTAIDLEVSTHVIEIQRLKNQIKKYKHPCTDVVVPDRVFE